MLDAINTTTLPTSALVDSHARRTEETALVAVAADGSGRWGLVVVVVVTMGLDLWEVVS